MYSVIVGEQLHLQHGPIDLLISVDAPIRARLRAFEAASLAFDGLLEELVSELPILKTRLNISTASQSEPAVTGPVARRMVEATKPYEGQMMLTPMAAVAGAVADEIGAAIARSLIDSTPQRQRPIKDHDLRVSPATVHGKSGSQEEIRRWMVNNGGDIALWLAPGQQYRAGLVVDPTAQLNLDSLTDQAITIYPEMRVGGIATSGWRGRSFSLGIADAVTVLAPSAAAADAAATLIANEVNLKGHPMVARSSAVDLDSNSDLGTCLVTTGVGHLTSEEVSEALRPGLDFAEKLCARGTIIGAALHLSSTVVSTVAPTHPPGALPDGIRNSLLSRRPDRFLTSQSKPTTSGNLQ